MPCSLDFPSYAEQAPRFAINQGSGSPGEESGSASCVFSSVDLLVVGRGVTSFLAPAT